MTSEYASPQSGSASALSDHRTYWRVSALALAAVAALGVLINTLGGNNAYFPNIGAMESFLVFDWTHNVVHVLLAGIAFAFGFTALKAKPLAKTMAAVIGVVYLGLGVVGFIPGVVTALDSLLHLHLEVGENLIHILLGGWGAYAGFS